MSYHYLEHELGGCLGSGTSRGFATNNDGCRRAFGNFDALVLQALSAGGAELERRQVCPTAKQGAHRAYDMAQAQIAAGATSILDLLVAEQFHALAD